MTVDVDTDSGNTEEGFIWTLATGISYFIPSKDHHPCRVQSIEQSVGTPHDNARISIQRLFIRMFQAGSCPNTWAPPYQSQGRTRVSFVPRAYSLGGLERGAVG